VRRLGKTVDETRLERKKILLAGLMPISLKHHEDYMRRGAAQKAWRQLTARGGE